MCSVDAYAVILSLCISVPATELSDVTCLLGSGQCLSVACCLQAIFNAVPNCSLDSSTAALNSLLSSNSQNNTFFQLPFNCTTPVPVWRTSSDAIQDTLYCGFKQVQLLSKLQQSFMDGSSTSLAVYRQCALNDAVPTRVFQCRLTKSGPFKPHSACKH